MFRECKWENVKGRTYLTARLAKHHSLAWEDHSLFSTVGTGNGFLLSARPEKPSLPIKQWDCLALARAGLWVCLSIHLQACSALGLISLLLPLYCVEYCWHKTSYTKQRNDLMSQMSVTSAWQPDTKHMSYFSISVVILLLSNTAVSINFFQVWQNVIQIYKAGKGLSQMLLLTQKSCQKKMEPCLKLRRELLKLPLTKSFYLWPWGRFFFFLSQSFSAAGTDFFPFLFSC